MSKSHFLSAFVLLTALYGSAQEGVKFNDLSWSEALELSEKSGKLIFLEGYVNWSQPCAILEKYTFTDSESGTFFNTNFINIRMDMEDIAGAVLAEEYEVSSFPVLLFLDSRGEVVHRGCGAVETDELITLGKAALGAGNLSEMQQHFEEGERSLDFLVDYSLMLADACMDPSALVEAYFTGLPHSKWMEESAWAMINLNVTDPFSEPFQYLMAYHDMYGLRYGKDTVDQKIHDVMLDQLIAIYEGEDLTLFATQALRQLLNDVDFDQKNELLSLVNLKTADLKANWPAYAENAVKVVAEQQVEDPDQLNEFAWKFYLFVDDEGHLNAAKNWMRGVLDNYPSATYYDSYASLLFKLGEKKEAVKYSEKALQAAEVELEDLMYYQNQLKFFTEGQ
ncbi:MAG: DUF255 domain-containing protein [Marinoscillum sp.]|uniref:thioredoxin family protein n=1 Tax=Marinoscillum sp. TaxID=2024838 RepID=UPI0032F4D54F